MLVEVTATNSFIVSRPVLTPVVHSTGMPVFSPPVPLGLAKLPMPAPLLRRGEGAVVGRHHLQRARLQPGPQRVLGRLLRNGGHITRRAA